MPISPHKTLYVPKAHLVCTHPHTPGPHIEITTEEQFKESAVLPLITSSDNAFSCSPTWPCFIREPLFPSYQSKNTGISYVMPLLVVLLVSQVLCRHIQDFSLFPAWLQNLALSLLKVLEGVIHFSPVEGRRWTTWSCSVAGKYQKKTVDETYIWVGHIWFACASPVPKPETWERCFARSTWITMYLGPPLMKKTAAAHLSKVLPADLSIQTKKKDVENQVIIIYLFE